MTIDEFLKQVRERAEVLDKSFGNSDADALTARQTMRLLAIIEAQRAEMGKVKAGIEHVCSADDFEAGMVFLAMLRDDLCRDSVEAKFERGEL